MSLLLGWRMAAECQRVRPVWCRLALMTKSLFDGTLRLCWLAPIIRKPVGLVCCKVWLKWREDTTANLYSGFVVSNDRTGAS